MEKQRKVTYKHTQGKKTVTKSRARNEKFYLKTKRKGIYKHTQGKKAVT